MGADYYYLEKSIEEQNGHIAQDILEQIITVIEDDKPFKYSRIKRLTQEWMDAKEEL